METSKRNRVIVIDSDSSDTDYDEAAGASTGGVDSDIIEVSYRPSARQSSDSAQRSSSVIDLTGIDCSDGSREQLILPRDILSHVSGPMDGGGHMPLTELVPHTIQGDMLFGLVVASAIMIPGFTLPSNMHRLLGVYLRRDRTQANVHSITILDDRQRPLGVMDRSTTTKLCNLFNDQVTCRNIVLTAGIPPQEQRANNSSSGGTVLSMCIMFYGRPEYLVAVTAILASHRIQLKTPLEWDVLLAEGRAVADDGTMLSRGRVGGSSGGFDYSAYTPTYQTAVRSVDLAQKQIEDLFVSLQDSNNLALTEPGDSLQTALFPHQKMALTFLLAREQNADIDNPYSVVGVFWKKKAVYGTYVYENMISRKAVSELPVEPKGGILADEMGLGKSLAILSLLVSKSTSFGPDSPHTNLLICPPSVISNWQDQVETHLKSNHQFTICVYHGGNRRTSPEILSSYDLVITTYSTLASDYRKCGAGKRKNDPAGDEIDLEKSPLHNIFWKRVILDEAHIIKDVKTSQAKAVHALDACAKWCLTGTPLQNKLDDLYSLIKFVGIEPFCEWDWWNKHISKSTDAADGLRKLQALMKVITLRRVKTQKLNGKPIIEVPPRKDSIWYVELEPKERALYDKVFGRSQEVIKEMLASSSFQQGYARVFELILRLRQICVHSALVANSDTIERILTSNMASITNDSAADIFRILRESGDDYCGKCEASFDDAEDDGDAVDAVITNCRHLVCRTCFNQLKSQQKPCPLCQTRVVSGQIVKLPKTEMLTSPVREPSQDIGLLRSDEMSAKFKALIADLLRHRSDRIKSVVFSQWTKLLDLLEIHFRRAGIQFLRFDGSMTVASRKSVLDTFRKAPTAEVMLMSLKAGGVGLNLTCASRVYLLDPWWNPSVESQAVDRVHRLGQKLEVETIRIVVTNSIEEKILALQDQKAQLAKDALMDKSDTQNVRKLKSDDLRYLFES